MIPGQKTAAFPRLRHLFLQEAVLHQINVHLYTAEDTRKLGAVLGASVEAGVVIALLGDLGAGKTTFTQGLAEALDIEEAVISPTFLMLNEYHSGRLPLYHFDLYRLQEDIEAGSAAMSGLKAEFDEIMQSDCVAVIEWLNLWPEFCAEYDELRIELSYTPEGDGRQALISARGAGAEGLLQRCQESSSIFSLK
jgi:tRNA threonylcarbamoyladenosine biosynthesis protein TsaE